MIGYRDLHLKGLTVFDVKATCDSLESAAVGKAEALAAFQGFRPRVYTNLYDMLKNESLDAVDIALPHNMHHTVAVRCLEEGLNVIVEKPLSITMRTAKLTIEKAEKHGKVLAVAENYRRTTENRAAWWVLKQGLLGDPRMIVWAAAGWGPKPWGWREDKYVAGGSWVFDGGVHLSDLDRYQLGREAVEVYAVQDTFDPVKEGVTVTVDDVTMAIIRYEGRVYAQWLWSRAAPGKPNNIRIVYGSKGSLDGEGLNVQKEESIESYRMNTLVAKMMEDLSTEEKGRWFPGDVKDSVATELYDFYDSVVNRRKPEVDGWEGYKDMAIPLGFYESKVLGRNVNVRDVEELRVEEYQKEINEKLNVI